MVEFYWSYFSRGTCTTRHADFVVVCSWTSMVKICNVGTGLIFIFFNNNEQTDTALVSKKKQ